MKYTKFGNTDANVSRLGFGCMRLPTIELNDKIVVDEDAAISMLRKGYELGINYFDTAYFYHDGQSEVILGKAIKGIRDKVYVSSKSPGSHIKSKDDYRRILEEQLKRLDISYIDFYHFHGINYEAFTDLEEKCGWYKAALKAKDEGFIKHISFSFHTEIPFSTRTKEDEESDHMIKLIDTGNFESVLCQYNVLDQKNKRGMKHAKEKGMGVVVMGPLGGGRISGMPKEKVEKLNIKVSASAELGLRFVASNPNIDIILSGMSSETQVCENAEYVSRITPLSEQEIEGIKTMMDENKKLSDLYCTGCNYCMPCPYDVAIPTIFQQTNYYKIYGIKDYARQSYEEIGSQWLRGKRADACIECGLCETKCPQRLKIRDQLKESHILLS